MKPALLALLLAPASLVAQDAPTALARAEDEVSRELVLRIPVSEKLKAEMARRAVDQAEQLEEAGTVPAEPGVVEHPIAPARVVPAQNSGQILGLK